MATKQCSCCGKPIEGRRGNAKYCQDCAMKIRKGYVKKVTGAAAEIAKERYLNYAKELAARDTPMQPITEKRQNSLYTGEEHTYIICPACNGVLNQYDRFCRQCGQRLKEGSKNDSWR